MIPWLNFGYFLYWIPISVLGWLLQLPAGVVVFFFTFMVYPDWCCCCPGGKCPWYANLPNYNPDAIALEINDAEKKKKN